MRPPNSTKVLSISYSSIFMTSASEYFGGASEWSWTKYESVFVANDNILKAMVTILMEETLVDNFF